MSAAIHTESIMDTTTSVLCRAVVLASFLFSFCASQHQKLSSAVDYKRALSNSILYFEAQRSGKLPHGQRVRWRGDSALSDGSDANVDLVGGYYDAGDNVKFGFPMAFTVTMLSWSAVEFGPQLASKGEISNAMAAIRWGTDYLLKASAREGMLYAEVGDGDSDHSCWERPEDMTTPRTSYRIDRAHPGSDLVGETSAAMAAASVAFRKSDVAYAKRLLDRAKKLFDFARTTTGVYSNSIPAAQKFYASSGYKDELLWAAAWLHLATGDQVYLDYLGGSDDTGGVRSLFSWDDKFVGVQTLVSKLVLEGKVRNEGVWGQYKNQGEQFLCNLVQKGNDNVKLSPGGMVWWQPWNNFQYTTSALLSLVSYSDYLLAASNHATLHCPLGNVAPEQLIAFSRSQVDYILGENPKRASYMVGFGENYPREVHHRGASIVSVKKDPTPVGCHEGFDRWFNRNSPNPNVLVGAVVGGPDANDMYSDSRSNYQQAEAATVNTAPFVGVLARLA